MDTESSIGAESSSDSLSPNRAAQVDVGRAPAITCPYFGLPPAGIEDAELFFGRDHELARARAELERHGVLLVSGSSGVGKSSFVRAGIAADCIAQGRRVVIVTPGEHPARVLRELPDPEEGALLIVDQCEQAFAAAHTGETEEFFDELVRWVFRGPIVVVIRADRLGDLADHEGFTAIIQSHLLMLGPLSTDGLRSVVTEPAQRAGLILEPGLVEILVRDADGRALPLLSHALRQVWLRRDGRVLTVDAYRASGEIDSAVAQTAEEVYAALPDGGARLVRDLLLRLVDASPDGRVVARRVERSAITIDSAHEAIAEVLVDARLLTSDEGSLQLSHESLAREWPRLREWLADDVEGQRTMAHLSAAATAWDEMGRPDSELYRGPRLVAAQHWRDAARPALTQTEADYLDAAAERETGDLVAARHQLARERRLVRRLVWLSGGAAALAVVAAGAGIAAGVQGGLAAVQTTQSDARRIAALAVDEAAFDRALLLAVEAQTLWDAPETQRSTVVILSRAPRVSGVMTVADAAPISAMSTNVEGGRAVMIDRSQDLRLLDLASSSQRAVYSPVDRALSAAAIDPATGDVAFSEANQQCALARCDVTRTAAFDMERTTGRAMRPLGGWDRVADDLEYSPDGSVLAGIARVPLSTPDGLVALWRADGDPTEAQILSVSGRQPGGSERSLWRTGTVRFSRDGSLLYVGGFGPTAVFDTATGARVAEIPGAGVVAVAADTDRIAVRDEHLDLRITDELGRGDGPTIDFAEPPAAAALDADGALLAVALGPEIVLFDADTGERIETLRIHRADVVAVDFGGGEKLVSADTAGVVVSWDVGDWSAAFRTASYVRASSMVEEDHRTLENELSGGTSEVVVAEPAAWAAHACAVAGRALTREEWAQYIGTRPYAPACPDRVIQASE